MDENDLAFVETDRLISELGKRSDAVVLARSRKTTMGCAVEKNSCEIHFSGSSDQCIATMVRAIFEILLSEKLPPGGDHSA